MGSKLISLKPCPFCGGVPELYGREIREYIQPINEGIKELTNNGWGKKSRREYWVQPRCAIACILGSMHSRAYGIIGGCMYTSKEAAAKAWNRRAEGGDDD